MFFRRNYEIYGNKPIIGFIIQRILRHYTRKYGFQIGENIGKGFYIGHFGTIIVAVIVGGIKIENNVNIEPNTCFNLPGNSIIISNPGISVN